MAATAALDDLYNYIPPSEEKRNSAGKGPGGCVRVCLQAGRWHLQGEDAPARLEYVTELEEAQASRKVKKLLPDGLRRSSSLFASKPRLEARLAKRVPAANEA